MVQACRQHCPREPGVGDGDLRAGAFHMSITAGGPANLPDFPRLAFAWRFTVQRPGRGLSSLHPFTDPRVRPDTSCLDSTANSTSTGMVTSIDAAE